MRLCIDYRKLNKKIIPDRMPIPRIQDIIDTLGGKKYFTTLDMSRAYHQCYMDESSIPLTAFSTPWGLFEWLRIPMGLSNAPPGFQREIEKTLAELRDEAGVPYLDDILSYGETFEAALENLRKIFQKLREKGI